MEYPRLVFDLILDQSRHSPQFPAILSPGKQNLSYQELSQHIQSIALQLSRLNIKPGFRVAVSLPNGPEMATAFVAISSICTCAPLNPNYPKHEVKQSLQNLGIQALLVLQNSSNPAISAAKELGIPIIELVPDIHTTGIFTLSTDIAINETIFKSAKSRDEDISLLMQTSGTTSQPKIVPLSQQNISYSVGNIISAHGLTASDRCLNMMPMFHIQGLVVAMLASLASGGSVICTPGYDESQVLTWIHDFKPTWYTAVPTLHQALLDLVRRQSEDSRGTHLRFIRSSSSILSPQLEGELESAFNAPVINVYGLTEAMHHTSNMLPPNPRKPGSVGKTVGSNQICIMDESGQVLPANKEGEICVRGGNVMAGYENNPEANKTTFRNGWLRTGDLGSLDLEGNLFIHGRIKDLINYAGEKISPVEVEEVLLNHPAVQEVVAFGVPHPIRGEDLAAAIVFKQGRDVSLQELRDYTSQRLIDFKQPRLYVILAEIPTGPTGKIHRTFLSEQLKEQLLMARKKEATGEDKAKTPIEEEIQSIWQEVLGMERIGVEDDFLVLGGDSLQATRILMLVNEKLNVNLTLNDTFNTPTISSMADLVKNEQDMNILP